jgi:phospho-N-acetylmuramoyl-pentapeptide-transferase
MRLIVAAGLVSLFVALLGTPLLIRFLKSKGFAPEIRQSTGAVAYPAHEAKRGTPSMGGLAIIVATVAGYAVAHLWVGTPPTVSGLLALGLMIALGLVGLVDDYLKVFKGRSAGVRARTKIIGQTLVAIAFGWLALSYNTDEGQPAVLSSAVSFIRDLPIALPIGLFIVWVWLLITATTNAVNLTDGLDGLAAGAAGLTIGSYVLIGLFQFGQSCALNVEPGCYEVRDPLDLAVFAAAVAGGLVGFLWWNSRPASIFMGDTGSLALGGAIAALALLTRTQLLLLLLGGLFVVVTLSVIMQVVSFRLFKKRVFRMAPIHHHFELLGWREEQIVVRLWIVQVLFVAAGLAVFYSEWVRG